MGWDTWGIVKIKGESVKLKEFVEKNHSFIDIQFSFKDSKCQLLETCISDKEINTGFIYWKFFAWKFDGEVIIEYISKMFPDLEFNSSFGSLELMWDIECMIKNGKRLDLYKVNRSEDNFIEVIVVQNDVNENYRYEKIDWSNLDIEWTNKEYSEGYQPPVI